MTAGLVSTILLALKIFFFVVVVFCFLKDDSFPLFVDKVSEKIMVPCDIRMGKKVYIVCSKSNIHFLACGSIFPKIEIASCSRGSIKSFSEFYREL